jgi:hypothetical protein
VQGLLSARGRGAVPSNPDGAKARVRRWRIDTTDRFRCNNAIGDLGEKWNRANRLAAYLFGHDPQMVELARLTRQRLESLRIASAGDAPHVPARR